MISYSYQDMETQTKPYDWPLTQKRWVSSILQWSEDRSGNQAAGVQIPRLSFTGHVASDK